MKTHSYIIPFGLKLIPTTCRRRRPLPLVLLWRGKRTSRLNLTEASDPVARVHESVAALPRQLNPMTPNLISST
jgi:hypothetical protein